MKSFYLCLVVFCATVAVPGCGGGSEETSLANEGLTADDFAKYEAELAAVSGDDSYAEELDADDAGTGDAATGDAATGDAATEATTE